MSSSLTRIHSERVSLRRGRQLLKSLPQQRSPRQLPSWFPLHLLLSTLTSWLRTIPHCPTLRVPKMTEWSPLTPTCHLIPPASHHHRHLVPRCHPTFGHRNEAGWDTHTCRAQAHPRLGSWCQSAIFKMEWTSSTLFLFHSSYHTNHLYMQNTI